MGQARVSPTCTKELVENCFYIYVCICVLYVILYVLLNSVDFNEFQIMFVQYVFRKYRNVQILENFKRKFSIKATCVSLRDSNGDWERETELNEL